MSSGRGRGRGRGNRDDDEREKSAGRGRGRGGRAGPGQQGQSAGRVGPTHQGRTDNQRGGATRPQSAQPRQQQQPSQSALQTAGHGQQYQERPNSEPAASSQPPQPPTEEMTKITISVSLL